MSFKEEIKQLAGDEVGYVFGAHKAAELILREMHKRIAKFEENGGTRADDWGDGFYCGMEAINRDIKQFIESNGGETK